jgi:CMP/dCMP kinase
MTLIVAVDGPGGSGKSSVSKAVARSLGFSYLDTGASYRLVTWLGLERGVDLDSAEALLPLVSEVLACLPLDPDDQELVLDGQNVTSAIREQRISAEVSRVAKLMPVREALNAGFREIAGAVTTPGVIVEGRDITTVVAPDAPVRVLLTASEDVRIQRRAVDTSSTEGAAQLLARDAKDAKVVDFLTPAPGVHTIDSTDLSFTQTIQALLDRVMEVYRPGSTSSNTAASE